MSTPISLTEQKRQWLKQGLLTAGEMKHIKDIHIFTGGILMHAWSCTFHTTITEEPRERELLHGVST